MARIQDEGGHNDWDTQYNLINKLDEAYKVEKEFWSIKSRIEWLQEEYKNTKYFYAVIAQRRKRNRIDRLEKQGGGICEGDREVAN